MKRKIIKQGHNTLTVTLPSTWIKKHDIKPGDEIDIQERNDALSIKGHTHYKEKCATIDITGFTIPLLWRFFQSAYRVGCNEIKIIYDPTKKDYEDAFHYYTTQFDYSKLGEKMPPKPAIMMLQSLVDRFIGMQIIETGKNHCTVKEIAQPTVKEFDSSMRRIFLIIKQMIERMIEIVATEEERDVSLCKEFHSIDTNVDKLVDYCSRILVKAETGFSEHKKTLLFTTLYTLEQLGDEVKYIGKHFAIADNGLKGILPLLEMIQSQFLLYYKLFYTFTREDAIAFGKGDFDLYSQGFASKGHLTPDEKSIARHLMAISKFTLSLVEMRIEMEFDGN